MQNLNLGILAHVDAGKTSLTERLLHAAGVIDAIGSVDDGNTQTDTLELERRRGITIKSAVVSFTVRDVAVNLIDTPGHPDFIAEVERVLGVLDGAVLVISAVEGVQAQTRVLMRALQRLRVPTLLFVNKIDRRGARPAAVLDGIRERLTPDVVAIGSVHAAGSSAAAFVPYASGDARFTADLTELLADHDDALLAAYLDEQTTVPVERVRAALVAQTRAARVHPVLFGSARTGAGVDALEAAIAELLPVAGGDPAGPAAGTVFKVDRGSAGERIAYVRMRSGALHTRDRVRLPGGDEGRVTAIDVFAGSVAERRGSVAAGQIAKVHGLGEVRIGDAIGVPRPGAEVARQFAPPALETVVEPCRPADRRALRVALGRLAEQDPLIALRHDEHRRELAVSLYGEVQKEVIQATLAEDFGIDARFRPTTVVCIERPLGTGAAVEIIGTAPNPFLATVGLRVDPAPRGSGVAFGLEVELGSMPLSFFTAVEETVHETLEQGLRGWQVVDCTVTMTRSGYWAKQSSGHAAFDKSMSSTARDFRQLTPLVLMAALRRAGTQVEEPVHRFALEVPADTVGAVLSALAQLGGVPASTAAPGQRPLWAKPGGPPGASMDRGAWAAVDGRIPAARVQDLRARLPGLTRGEGVLETVLDGHQPVRGAVPTRPRRGPDPLDRDAYVREIRRPPARE